MDRRTATNLIIIGGIGLVAACAQHQTGPTGPSTSRLQALDLVVGTDSSGKPINAPPIYHGYADGGEQLLEAMRKLGLNPKPIPEEELGAGTYRLSSMPSEFGWVLAVQNNIFSARVDNIPPLGSDQLWAAYKRLSIG